MAFSEIWEVVVPHRNRDPKELVLHDAFKARMKTMGYSMRQVQVLTEWWIQEKVASGEKIPDKK